MYDGTYDGLFKAKLRDNGIEFSEDDYKRFCTQLDNSFSKGVLDLSGQRIGINMLTKLTKVLRQAPHIRVFNLYGNLIRDHGIHSLLQLLLANQQVEVLDIGCNDLSNQAVPCLIDIIKETKIKSLQIGTTGLAWHNNKFSLLSLIDIIKAIQDIQRIECLNMSGLKMSYREGGKRRHIAEEMSDFIANNQVLKSFSLSDCSFVLREEAILTNGIAQNESLVFLDFHNNLLSDPVGPTFMRNLSNMIHLSYLDLTNCQLSPDAGVNLAETLMDEYNIITILKLSKNDLQDRGVSALLDVLKYNQTLTEVDISDNHFGSTEIAYQLNEVLKCNQVLYALDISKNSIGDLGAFAIADALEENNTLTKLSVSSCKITDKGAKKISIALVENQTLQYFKMSDNFLTCECGYTILEYIRQNEKLFVFDVTSTQINHFVIKALNDLSRRNKQIQKEVELQPLKKQLIQLSIQRTKMPEAEMRLSNLEDQRDRLEREVLDTESKLESTQVNADTNIKILKKSILDTKQMIAEEEGSKVKIEEEKQKMINDYENMIKDDEGSIFKEQTLLEEYETKADKVEQDTIKDNEEEAKKREEIQKLIDETLRLLNQTIEATNDPELLRNFEPPQFPIDPNEKQDPFFLVDQLAELQAAEESKSKKKKTKKKGKGKKKSSSPPSARKTKKGKNSPTNTPQLANKENQDNINNNEEVKIEGPRFLTESQKIQHEEEKNEENTKISTAAPSNENENDNDNDENNVKKGENQNKAKNNNFEIGEADDYDENNEQVKNNMKKVKRKSTTKKTKA